MMYSNYQLENNPSFKMTGKEFNTLVNSLTKEPTENSKPVMVGLTIRTATSNLVAKHDVEFNKVKGHADNELNNLCDKMAVEQVQILKNQLLPQIHVAMILQIR